MAEEADKPQAQDPPAGGQPDSASSPSENLLSQEELDGLLAQTGQSDAAEAAPAVAAEDGDAAAPEGAAPDTSESPSASADQPAPPEQPDAPAPPTSAEPAAADTPAAQEEPVGGDKSPPQPAAAGATDGAEDVRVSQEELDALVTQLEQTRKPDQAPTTPEPGGQADAPAGAGSDSDVEAEMAAAIATEMAAEQEAQAGAPPAEPTEPAQGEEPALVGSQFSSPSPETAAAPDVPDLAEPDAPEALTSIDLLDDVELDVKIELGRTQMYIEDVLRLANGAVIELEKLAGDPVDIFVNERLVAHGEVLVLNESFCVRINDIMAPTTEASGGD